MSDDEDMDLGERAFDAKERAGHLFRPLRGRTRLRSQPQMRADFLANFQRSPFPRATDPLWLMRNYRQEQFRWRCDFRRRRKPLPHSSADRIVFAHHPDLANELAELIEEADAICRLERENEESGRQGMGLVLLLSARLLERVPGPMAPLVSQLDRLRMRLAVVDEGDRDPMFLPAKSPPNRRKDAARRHELRLRCLLALHALLAVEENPTPARRLQLCKCIYERARNVAREVRGENAATYVFDEVMIANWYADPKWHPPLNRTGSDGPEYVRINAWAFFVLHQELLDAPDRSARKSIVERYLAALDAENFDRPLHAFGPRHWPPFDGS